MGRKPTPTPIRRAMGNPQHRPMSENEPRPTPHLPRAPSHLSDEAKKKRQRIGPELRAHGLMTKLDRATLAAYCQAWGRWLEAEEKLREAGPVGPQNSIRCDLNLG